MTADATGTTHPVGQDGPPALMVDVNSVSPADLVGHALVVARRDALSDSDLQNALLDALGQVSTEHLLTVVRLRAEFLAKKHRGDRAVGREFSLAATAVEEAHWRFYRGLEAMDSEDVPVVDIQFAGHGVLDAGVSEESEAAIADAQAALVESLTAGELTAILDGEAPEHADIEVVQAIEELRRRAVHGGADQAAAREALRERDLLGLPLKDERPVGDPHDLER